MEREYFCLVKVETEVRGGVEKKLVEFTLTVNPSKSSTEDLYWDAVNHTVRELTRSGELQNDQITVTGFSFYLNELPR